MPVDTLTPTGSQVVLAPYQAGPDGPYAPAGFATVEGADAVVVAYPGYRGAAIVYDLTGRELQTVWVAQGLGLSVASVGTGGFVVTAYATFGSPGGRAYQAGVSAFNSLGEATSSGMIDKALAPAAFSTPQGYHLEWNTVSGTGVPPLPFSYTYTEQDFTADGSGAARITGATGDAPQQLLPFAATRVGSAGDLTIRDNQAQIADHTAITIPGEPAHALTDVAAAGLTGGITAAVAWVDSGTDYVSIFNASTNSFGPVIGLDWGGAADLHLVALLDGGFVVSWMNGGTYKGEVFDAAGNGGGIISLAGQVAAIDSHGDLYTVGQDSSGNAMIQTYAINSATGSGGGGGGGQTFTSDDNGDHWVGSTGNDTFNLGRGGDVVTGNGGDDTYRFAAIPWAGGHITDFNAGDVLDLTGLMATTSDTGTDGFADGYLKITDDGSGNAQVWADYHIAGNAGWWLVETLDGVAPASLQHSGNVITVGASSGGGGETDVTVSQANFIAPGSVKTITLTGMQQHIDASATAGVTITSNDSGNGLMGGAGGDTFHLGRGGDWVSGGAGADTFAYAATPWAGGGITDFNAAEGDRIDVSGLLQASGYAGADPFADGYLKLTADASGNAQLWSDLNLPSNDGWWLVATLDGVSTSSLHYASGFIT